MAIAKESKEERWNKNGSSPKGRMGEEVRQGKEEGSDDIRDAEGGAADGNDPFFSPCRFAQDPLKQASKEDLFKNRSLDDNDEI